MSKNDHESLLGKLRAGLHGSMDAQLREHGVRPDFDAMMSRVRDLDESIADRYAERSSEAADEAITDVEPVDLDDTTLEAYVDALRQRVDDDIVRRRQQGPWARAPRLRHRLRWAWISVSAIGVAAAAVVGMLATDVLRIDSSVVSSFSALAAADQAQPSEWTGDATVRRSPGVRREIRAAASNDGVVDVPIIEPEVPTAGSTDGEEPNAPSTVDAEKAEVMAPSRARARRPSLDELDARAQRQWKAGQLRAAEASYWALVRAGGRQPQVELAYAELFALVRQRGGNLQPVWERYLQTFPRGRYASDAYAGLCRRAVDEARDACWQRYRVRFPRGIHAPDAAN